MKPRRTLWKAARAECIRGFSNRVLPHEDYPTISEPQLKRACRWHV